MRPQLQTRKKTAAADRGNDGQLATGLTVQLQADRALAGDDRRVVVGRDERCSVTSAELQCVGLRVVVAGAVLEELDRIGAERGHLRRRRVLRHDDRRRSLEPGRCPRDAEAMIARTCRHNTLVPFQRGDRSEGAAHFERPHRLARLELQEAVASDRARHERRRREDLVHNLPSGFEIRKRRRPDDASWSGLVVVDRGAHGTAPGARCRGGAVGSPEGVGMSLTISGALQSFGPAGEVGRARMRATPRGLGDGEDLAGLRRLP
jgi:hypothetical protein